MLHRRVSRGARRVSPKVGSYSEIPEFADRPDSPAWEGPEVGDVALVGLVVTLRKVIAAREEGQQAKPAAFWNVLVDLNVV